MHTLFFYINTAIIYPATIYYFFTRQMTLRVSKKWFMLICILQQDIKVLLMAYDVLVQKLPLLNLLTFLDDMLLTLLILLLFDESVWEKVFIYCTTLLLQTLPAMGIVLLCSRLIDTGRIGYRILSLIIWYAGYYAFIRFIIYLNRKLLSRFRAWKSPSQRRLAGVLFLFYYACEMAGLFTSIEALSAGSHNTPHIWQILTFVLFAACGGAVILASFNYFEDARLQQELRLIRAEKDLDYRAMQRQERSLEELHKMKHDQQNHLLILQGLLERGESKEADSYIAELIGRNEQTAKRWSLNKVADVVISDTAQRCESAGIRFQAEGQIPAQTDMEAADLSALLFNLFDNAAEAAERAGMEKPFVSASFAVKAEQLILVIRNSAAPADIQSIRNGLSSKPDKVNHGFGTGIIQEIVSQYEGILETESDDCSMTVRIILHPWKNADRKQVTVPDQNSHS
jgi:signal transduction histidine kinase